MAFKYLWKNKEANFGKPIKTEVLGGTHFAAECILKFNGNYVALRRPKAIPEHEIPPKALKSKTACLYDVHGLPRWGESKDEFIQRLVKDQAGVNVKNFRVAEIEMGVYPKTKQWYIEPVFFVEVDKLPTPGVYGNQVTEVVTFNKNNVPEDFGWWSKKQIEDFLKEYDK
jgi:hypothetical protein